MKQFGIYCLAYLIDTMGLFNELLTGIAIQKMIRELEAFDKGEPALLLL